jgi:hypothetical protein
MNHHLSRKLKLIGSDEFNHLIYILTGIYGNDVKGLILLCALFPTSVSILFMFTIRNIVRIGRQPHELKVFLNFFYLTIFLALFLMVVILLEKYIIDLTQAAIYTKSAIAMTVIALLFLPLIFVIKEEAAIWKQVILNLYLF